MLFEHSVSWMIVHYRVRGERAKVTNASEHFSTFFANGRIDCCCPNYAHADVLQSTRAPPARTRQVPSIRVSHCLSNYPLQSPEWYKNNTLEGVLVSLASTITLLSHQISIKNNTLEGVIVWVIVASKNKRKLLYF